VETQAAYLGIVIPAYNEEVRLPDTLRQVTTYLITRGQLWEVIVVDDGSSDHTTQVTETFALTESRVRLIRNPHCGKAYAVRTGIMSCKAEYLFLCDADLATPISELEKLLKAMEEGYDIAIGSREIAGAARLGEPWHRHLMGRVFNYLVRVLAVGEYQDTQCGFKGFRQAAAVDIFPRLRLYASPDQVVKGPAVTGFDVEVLFLAKKLGYKVAETPVVWHYMTGSKVNAARDSYRNLTDVIRVRYNDIRGRYG
jgi:dolichyl-phosphate beta-glucosyltransferase